MRLREAGIDRAEDAADEQDKAVVRQALRHFIASGEPFSANDVRALLPDVRRTLLGGAFLAASGAKAIVKVGYVPSSDPGTHGHRVALWQRTDAARRRVPDGDPRAHGHVPEHDVDHGRESVDAKAVRYLATNRLIVVEVSPDRIRAWARGERTYRLGLDGAEWWCSCPARRECAHVRALQLVTTRRADA